MSTAAVVIVAVIVIVAAGVLSLRASAKTGMPARDVLDRASRRARQLESDDEGKL